ncbi:unnamed protein product, partial [Amoebophrya sp. A25]
AEDQRQRSRTFSSIFSFSPRRQHVRSSAETSEQGAETDPFCLGLTEAEQASEKEQEDSTKDGPSSNIVKFLLHLLDDSQETRDLILDFILGDGSEEDHCSEHDEIMNMHREQHRLRRRLLAGTGASDRGGEVG